MDLDDDVCVCMHVSLRKLQNFALRVRPARPEQMTECLGAGTACGWCIPLLTRIAEAARRGSMPQIDESAADHQSRRTAYRAAKHAKNTFTGQSSPPQSSSTEAPPPNGDDDSPVTL